MKSTIGAVACGAMLCVVMAVVLYDELSSGRRITYENGHLIMNGMTEQDVRQILGCAPGDHRTRTAEYGGGLRQLGTAMHFPDPNPQPRAKKVARVETWTGNKAEVRVAFGDDGLVVGRQTNLPGYSGTIPGYSGTIVEDLWLKLLYRIGFRKPRMSCHN